MGQERAPSFKPNLGRTNLSFLVEPWEKYLT